MGEAPYQVVVRLYAYADYYWPELSARYYQINLLDLPLTRFLTLVFAWLHEVWPPEKWEMFVADLEAPIPGTERKVSDTSAEEEGASFMNAMSALRTK